MNLKEEILQLIDASTVSDRIKRRVKYEIDSLPQETLEKIHSALTSEKQKMHDLSEKKERIKFKYKVMAEKICKLKLES